MYVHAFDPQFRGTHRRAGAIARVARDFGVAVNRVELPGGDYTMDHSAVVFLLDDAAQHRRHLHPALSTSERSARDLQRAAPYLHERAVADMSAQRSRCA